MPFFASTTSARVAQLSRLGCFPGLSKRDLRKVARAASPLSVPPDETVTMEDAVADGSYVVLSGELSVYRSGELVRSLVAGDVIGEIGLLEGRRTATVRAAAASELLYFPAAISKTLCEELPAFEHALRQTARKRRNRDHFTE